MKIIVIESRYCPDGRERAPVGPGPVSGFWNRQQQLDEPPAGDSPWWRLLESRTGAPSLAAVVAIIRADPTIPAGTPIVVRSYASNTEPHELHTCTGHSSHGSFSFDPVSGWVVEDELDDSEDEFPIDDHPVRVDVAELRAAFPDRDVAACDWDILDLGFWSRDGGYCDPEGDWREQGRKIHEQAVADQERIARGFQTAIPAIDRRPKIIELSGSDDPDHWFYGVQS